MEREGGSASLHVRCPSRGCGRPSTSPWRGWRCVAFSLRWLGSVALAVARVGAEGWVLSTAGGGGRDVRSSLWPRLPFWGRWRPRGVCGTRLCSQEMLLEGGRLCLRQVGLAGCWAEGRAQSLYSERLPPSPLPSPLSPNAAMFFLASCPTPAVWPGHQHPQRPHGSVGPLLSFSRLVSLKCKSDFWRLPRLRVCFGSYTEIQTPWK